MRGCCKQNQLLAGFIGEVFQKTVTLLLVFVCTDRLGTGMRFIDNDKIGAMVEEYITTVVLLDEVNGNNLVRYVAKDILVRA